jgi:hypothetical protein
MCVCVSGSDSYTHAQVGSDVLIQLSGERIASFYARCVPGASVRMLALRCARIFSETRPTSAGQWLALFWPAMSRDVFGALQACGDSVRRREYGRAQHY